MKHIFFSLIGTKCISSRWNETLPPLRYGSHLRYTVETKKKSNTESKLVKLHKKIRSIFYSRYPISMLTENAFEPNRLHQNSLISSILTSHCDLTEKSRRRD